MKRSRSIMRAGPQRSAQNHNRSSTSSPSAHLALTSRSLLSQRTGTARVTSAYQRFDDPHTQTNNLTIEPSVRTAFSNDP